MHVTNKRQLTLIVLLLIFIGVGAAVYKNRVLGFSFLPDKHEKIWTVEATITFMADGGPVIVSMNMPDERNNMTVLDEKSIEKDYAFEKKNGRFIWKKQDANGPQKIFFQANAYHKDSENPKIVLSPEKHDLPVFEGSYKQAVDYIVSESVKSGKGSTAVAVRLLNILNSADSPESQQLLKQADDYGGKLNLARSLLQLAGIQSRATRGLWLDEENRKQKLKGYIEVYENKNWILINQRTAEVENRVDFLVWQYDDESILEIIGGSGSKISFSTISGNVLAQRAAIEHGKFEKNTLIDFSIYSLPVAEQNAFKLLLLIPIGALIIVILRNVVGIATSGTFMPILIAMVLLQTSLLPGIALFLIVVSIGLILRSYLSHLNLLLVPRISAVLVFVIIIYVVISVVSIKMGFEAGLQVTFFPMIIISWTIERMSILWEEEGPKDVLIQGGGSLFSASIIYLVMQSTFINHLTYSFPELLLVVLAVIIMIGSYSGYRLTELRRFEPLIKES
jgi:hypothetical protein